MYCPKCAAENIETASYCRSCGMDVRFVSQALSGQLPVERPSQEIAQPYIGPKKRKEDESANLGKGIENIFIGIGFLLVSFAILRFMPGGFIWWYWMLIPAFACIGKGISHFVRLKGVERKVLPQKTFSEIENTRPTFSELPTAEPNPNFIFQPKSVTEATTRHLGTPVEGQKEKF